MLLCTSYVQLKFTQKCLCVLCQYSIIKRYIDQRKQHTCSSTSGKRLEKKLFIPFCWSSLNINTSTSTSRNNTTTGDLLKILRFHLGHQCLRILAKLWSAVRGCGVFQSSCIQLSCWWAQYRVPRPSQNLQKNTKKKKKKKKNNNNNHLAYGRNTGFATQNDVYDVGEWNGIFTARKNFGSVIQVRPRFLKAAHSFCPSNTCDCFT